ncbi:DUF4381 domain-containing protein [Albimonas pacifica]|nr:DUF4381 domain-containing protein [Albimonas pacifica]
MRLAQASPPASSPGATSTDAAQGAETLAPGAAQPGEFVSLIDLLDELRAPPPPPPVAMTPQTAGWLVVGAVLALLLGWVLLAARRRRRANAWRREALAALAQAGDDPAAVAPILRRAALALRPRAEVAGLTGAGWLAFLDATGGPGFAEGPGRALASGPYDGRGAPAPGLGALAARWVRRARAEGGR